MNPACCKKPHWIGDTCANCGVDWTVEANNEITRLREQIAAMEKAGERMLKAQQNKDEVEWMYAVHGWRKAVEETK